MTEESREQNLSVVETSESRPALLDPPSDQVGMQDDDAVSPVKLVADRMHGRWLWATALGCTLGLSFGVLGYRFGPVKYDAMAVLAVESRLDTLVEETLETKEIKVDQEVQEQAQNLRSPQVLYRAVRYDDLAAFDMDQSRVAERIDSNLKVEVPPRAALVLVSVSDEDPKFAAVAVNSIVKAYEEIYAPDRDVDFEDKMRQIRIRLDSSTRTIAELKRNKIDLLRDSQYAITDVDAIISSNVDGIRRLEVQVAEIDAQIARIREGVAVTARRDAESESREATAEEMEPRISDRVDPEVEQLAMVDPGLPDLKENLAQLQIAFDLISKQFGSEHMQYRRSRSNLEAQRSSYESRLESARTSWMGTVGKGYTWGALTERRASVLKSLEDLRIKNAQLALDMIDAEDLEQKIKMEISERMLLKARELELDRERISIRKGRISVASDAFPALLPSENKRVQYMVLGSTGGFLVAFGIFFLIGSIDQKTFGVTQLRDHRNTLRVLGVMPDMDESGEESDSVMLATDCVHRIRARIESRRSPETGYAMMVSSPFQGDGKTTLGVSLGWSYAESGYKTLLIDADFIGRSMSHQFGHLKDPGLREIMLNGEVRDEIRELGHPNLSLLSVGFDRRISAANLSARIMRMVVDAVRDRYDILIIDTGPITASIEAMPVASVADGVVLALRRGRSRAKLSDCISDIRATGADYLGVVLNYAKKSDCISQGSASQMSVTVRDALGEEMSASSPESINPLIGGSDLRGD